MLLKRDDWRLFSWNLTKLAGEPVGLPHGLSLRPALREEESAVLALVARAFAFDQQWSGSYGRIADAVELRIREAFRSQPNAALVLCHGSRIVAASCLDSEPDSQNHLFSGPCVLPEYCNRGLATALLHQSLHALKRTGVYVARAICKEGTVAGKFVYSKFGSVSEPYDSDPFPSAQ